MGKVLAEAGGDVQEAIDMLYYMGGEGRRLFGQTSPSRAARQVRVVHADAGRRRRRDHAVELPDRDPVLEARAALICGNTVVFKPAEDTPLLAARFIELLVEAGLPKGVVNLVFGYGEVAGDAIVRHPDVPIDHLHRLHRDRHQITKAAAEASSASRLELGGKNVIIVMEDADLDLAVEGIVWSAFGTSGQRCTAA